MAFIVHAADATTILSMLALGLSLPEHTVQILTLLFFYLQIRTFLVLYLDQKNQRQTSDTLFGFFELFSILGSALAAFTAGLSPVTASFFTLLFGLTILTKYSLLVQKKQLTALKSAISDLSKVEHQSEASGKLHH